MNGASTVLVFQEERVTVKEKEEKEAEEAAKEEERLKEVSTASMTESFPLCHNPCCSVFSWKKGGRKANAW